MCTGVEEGCGACIACLADGPPHSGPGLGLGFGHGTHKSCHGIRHLGSHRYCVNVTNNDLKVLDPGPHVSRGVQTLEETFTTGVDFGSVANKTFGQLQSAIAHSDLDPGDKLSLPELQAN